MFRVSSIAVTVAGLVGAAAIAEDSWRIRGEFVESKEGDPGRVVLRLPDGALVTLPLSAFDDAGQASIRSRTAPPPGPAATGDLPAPFAEDLAACRSAEEACDACRLFLADPGTAASARVAIEARLRELEPRAARGDLRHGNEWVSPEVAATASAKADVFLVQAMEMIRLGNLKLARQELTKASRSDPLDGRADFLLGLGLLVGSTRDLDEAATAFEEVVRREPANGAALNNLAVCNLERRRLKGVAAAMRDAAASLDSPQPVIDNLARVIQIASNPRVGITGNQLEELTSLYHELMRGRAGGTQSTAGGWTVLLPNGGAIPPGADLTALMAAGGPWETDAAGTERRGCGIVVARGYVLVPVNLPYPGGSLRIAASTQPVAAGLPDQSLEATIVAASDAAGLALVRCEPLDCPPLGLAADPLEIDSEVVAVVGGKGPASTGRGMGLDSPRRRVIHSVSLPHWVSGVPLMDARGRVVGIAIPSPRFRASGCRLAFALDMGKVVPFVRDQLPDFEQAGGDSATLTWKEVVGLGQAGTVQVVARPPPGSPTP